MRGPSQRKGPKLPASLLEGGGSSSTTTNRSDWVVKATSRKEQRRNKKEEKKRKVQEWHKNHKVGRAEKAAARKREHEGGDGGPPLKRAHIQASPAAHPSTDVHPSILKKASSKSPKAKKATDKHQSVTGADKPRKKVAFKETDEANEDATENRPSKKNTKMTTGSAKKMYTGGKPTHNQNFFKLLEEKGLLGGDTTATEDEDDRIIREMSKKLGLKKGKKLPANFKEDGLAYILYGSDEEDHILDEEDVGLAPSGKGKGGVKEVEGEEGEDVDEDEDVDDFLDSFGQEEMEEGEEGDNVDGGEEDEEVEEGEEDEEDEEVEEGEEDDEVEEGEEDDEGDSMEEREEDDEMEEGEEGDSMEEGEEDEVEVEEAPKVESSAPEGKYVPPHLRKALGGDEALRRRVKGQMNKLNEATFVSVVGEIEGLYMTHSRNAVNETITDLVLELLLAESRQMDRLTLLYSGLLTALHNIIGMEVGAYFLQTVTEKFEKFYNGMSGPEDKRCSNLMAVLGHLYNFKVIYSGLIFDYVRRFVQSFKEADVEMLLLLLQNVGTQLRNDDPTAIKDIVLEVQEQAKAHPELMKPGSRGKFMVETMTDVKNNKERKGRLGGDDTSHLLGSLKNLLGDLKRQKTSSGGEATLRVSLKDILNAKDRGRWWLVGSAWKGRDEPIQYRQVNDEQVAGSKEKAKLQELAKKMHMNTDVRKAVFFVLMSSEDYADAYEKILRLGLKDKQEREVIKVIIHCCLHEGTFNPYYCHLAAKFCKFNHNHKFTLQYTMWDQFKELPNMGVRQMLHLARFLAFLVVDFSVSLSIIKVVQFSNMDIKTLTFFRMFFIHLLTENPEEKVREVFRRIAPLKDLGLLKEQLSMFLQVDLPK
eukprot:Ihof_evm2s151 gene=Ihof_evmTU2s151